MADARSPTITLWSAPRGARLEQQLLLALRGSRSSGLVRLHIDASVEWHEGAKGPERALYECVGTRGTSLSDHFPAGTDTFSHRNTLHWRLDNAVVRMVKANLAQCRARRATCTDVRDGCTHNP